MKKIEVPYVAMAVLLISDDQHSDAITRAILDSDLSELGYKGGTPDRTVNSQLRNAPRYAEYFTRGRYRSHFRLADRERSLRIPEVCWALSALKQQKALSILIRLATVEFTFVGTDLVAVRNAEQLLVRGTPGISNIVVPVD